MSKRVHEIAKERGVPAKEVLAALRAAGVNVKAASSSVDEATVARVLGNGGDAGDNGPALQSAPRSTATAASSRPAQAGGAAQDQPQAQRPALEQPQRQVQAQG